MKVHSALIPIMRRILQVAGVLAMLFCLSAWSFPASSTTTNSAYIRVVHASPDVGIVDVFVDGTKLLSSFQFATVTEYVPLPSGSHLVQIALLGKGVNATMLAQTIKVQANDIYTVSVIGTKASGFSIHVFTDNDVVNGTAAKFRAYYLSSQSKSVSVDEGKTAVIRDLSYGQVSDYIALTSGQHVYSLSGVEQNLTATFSVTAKPWTVTSVFVISLPAGKSGLQFVTAQVQGIPGMPNTGSDPAFQASQTATPPAWPFWLAGTFLLVIPGCGICIYLLTASWKTRHSVPGRLIGSRKG